MTLSFAPMSTAADALLGLTVQSAAAKSVDVSFIASIAVLAQVAIVLLLVGAVASRVSPAARQALAAPRDAVGRHGVWLAWFVATFATAASLYLSEVKGFHPCHLCWLQRYFMYPLVGVLIIVALLRRRWLTWAAIIIPVIGASISARHVYVEYNPSAASQSCRIGIPCSFKWVDEFGYITIPLMAGTAFVLVIVLLAIAGAHQRTAKSLAASSAA